MALPDTSENQILERIVRIEESLAHHIELTRQGFSEMNRRFELLLDQTNKRFDQVDRRFDALTRRMDRFMVWSFSTTLAVGSIVIGVLKVWL